LALSVVVIVEVSNSFSQGFDIVVDFWSALAEIGPLVWLVEEAMFRSLFSTPGLLSKGMYTAREDLITKSHQCWHGSSRAQHVVCELRGF
jgi:hypothetical protein